jgi:hypothetical protein
VDLTPPTAKTEHSINLNDRVDCTAHHALFVTPALVFRND